MINRFRQIVEAVFNRQRAMDDAISGLKRVGEIKPSNLVSAAGYFLFDWTNPDPKTIQNLQSVIKEISSAFGVQDLRFGVPEGPGPRRGENKLSSVAVHQAIGLARKKYRIYMRTWEKDAVDRKEFLIKHGYK